MLPIQPRRHRVRISRRARQAAPRASQHTATPRHGVRRLFPRRPRRAYPGGLVRPEGSQQPSQESGPSSRLPAQPRHRARQRWFTNARAGRRGGEPPHRSPRRRRRARRGARPRRGQSGRRRRQSLGPYTTFICLTSFGVGLYVETYSADAFAPADAATSAASAAATLNSVTSNCLRGSWHSELYHFSTFMVPSSVQSGDNCGGFGDATTAFIEVAATAGR